MGYFPQKGVDCSKVTVDWRTDTLLASFFTARWPHSINKILRKCPISVHTALVYSAGREALYA